MLEMSLYENQISDIIEAQNGKQSAMEKLINVNNGLIWSIVRRFKDRGYELEDLYQVAVIGFIKSIKKFDTNFEVKLSTYAVPYILGEIKRYIQTNGPIKISRTIKELQYKIVEQQKEALKKGKEITIEELSKELNVSKEEIVVSLESNVTINSIYDSDSNKEDGLNILETLASGIDEQTILTNKIAITELIKNLKDSYYNFFEKKYFFCLKTKRIIYEKT